MKNQLVSPDTAFRLKKNGFYDDSCWYFLYEDSNGKVKQGFGWDDPYRDKLIAYLPSQFAAQRFIRENLDIHIIIMYRHHHKKWVGMWHPMSDPSEFEFTFLHDTYEGVLEEALMDCMRDKETECPIGKPYTGSEHREYKRKKDRDAYWKKKNLQLQNNEGKED
jgi:hypothetical protein